MELNIKKATDAEARDTDEQPVSDMPTLYTMWRNLQCLAVAI